MPRRFLSDEVRTSKSTARLSAEARVLMDNLITVADDFGRFEADPLIVCATAFPRPPVWLEEGVEQVEGLLEELAEAGEDGDNPIISFYCSDGRVYGCFGSGWRKVQGAPRAKKSKFPDPSACAQLDRSLRAACAHVDRSVNANVLASVSDSESESDSGAAQGFSMPDRRRQAQAIIGGWWQADMLAVRGKSVNPDPRAVVIAGEWAVGMAQADVKTAVNKLVRDDDPFVVKRGWTLAMLPERAPGYLTGLVGKSDADRAMEEA